MQLKVSVIIPCYNVEEYIEECINSVLLQTYEYIEIICVDDGSSDGTVPKIRKLQSSSNADIRLIETQNRGASAARNTGLQYATGEYIQFLDADDILLPEKIEHGINLIKNNSCMISFVVGDCIRRYYNGTEQIIRADPRSHWYGLLGIRLGNTCSNLWSKKVLEEVSGWDETLISSQEYDLMFRMLQNEPVIIYDRELNTIIRHREAKSISQTNISENRLIALKLRQRIYKYLSEKNLFSEDLKQHYYQLLFTDIRTLFTYDRAEAIRQYKQLLPDDFLPLYDTYYQKSYRQLFKLIGFKHTQIIWNGYLKFRSKFVFLRKVYNSLNNEKKMQRVV